FRDITGYREEELLGEGFAMKELIHEVEEGGLNAMKERAAGDKTPKSYRVTLITKHSEIRRLAVNTVILEDERGPYTLGIALDITQLIESERTLRELNAELSERNEELKQFAQLASHNLRAPVSNMVGLLGIYERGTDPNPVNKTVIKSLSKATSDLSMTLEEMHSVLRMRAEESHQFGSVSLIEILEKTCVILKNEIDGAKMKICIDFDIEELNYVRCHIENFFFNLISNAVKYRSRDRLPALNITSRLENSTAVLTFADNGIGIDLERHGKDIFGMYKRFHNHPDSRGIGLYLVHAQLKSLGGTIEVDSKSGEGTTFILKLKLPDS
ncbi:MAG: ATP-binding protein, partial [Cryomorphaceae bacterium]